MDIKEKWNNLSATTRRRIVWVVAAVALIGPAYLFVSSEPAEVKRRDPREDVVQSILTGTNTRELGVEGIASETRRLERTLLAIQQEVEALKQRDQRDTKKVEELIEKRVERASGQIVREISTLIDQKLVDSQASGDSKTSAQRRAESRPEPQAPASGVFKPTSTEPPEQKVNPQQLWKPEDRLLEESASRSATAKKSESPKLKIRLIENAETADRKAAEEQRKERAEEADTVYLPAGSIVSGTLITGLDAPTSAATRADPFPALVRVKKEAILPNHFRLDVRECFIVASGYGDLSSERAYLRSEVLSCVREDGGVIEVPVNMYAVGEDGKAGIAGRLVSKQGQMIAKSMTAGFFEGFSSMFRRLPVPTISTEARDTTIFQSMLSSDAVQSATLTGAGRALDRIAQFYLDMAEGMFPVIEVNAGRPIEFVVTKGGRIKPVNP